MIHIFSSKGQVHLDGHKELSKNEPVVEFMPEKVLIPAVDNKGVALANLVEVGATVQKGSLLGVRQDFQIPVYSPVTGTVAAVVKVMSPVVGRPVNFLQITVEKEQGEEVKLAPLASDDKESVVAKLKEGGIVGLGGAGFPTYIKYNTKDPIDTILINAVECEPYLTTDYVEGIERISDVFLALPALLKASGAQRVVIATKSDKVHLIEAIEKGIAESGMTNVTCAKVKDVYPMGWEKTLIKAALKREYDGLPSKCGVIVNNLQTVMAIGRLFAYGEVITSKVFTVSGKVSKPGNYRAPVGTVIADLIGAAGGYSNTEAIVLAGGPMTSKPLANDSIPTFLQTSGVTVLDRVVRRTEPCLRCGTCVDHCPANLQPVSINEAAERLDIALAKSFNADACVECGICSYVCPSHIDLTANIAKMKLMIRLKANQKK